MSDRQHLMPLDTLARSAHARIRSAERKMERSDDMFLSAGLELKEAKARLKAGESKMTWPAFLEQHCPIGRSRADELIMVAEGRKSMEEMRAEQRVRRAHSRATQRVRNDPPGRHGNWKAHKEGQSNQQANGTIAGRLPVPLRKDGKPKQKPGPKAKNRAQEMSKEQKAREGHLKGLWARVKLFNNAQLVTLESAIRQIEGSR